MSLQPNTSIAHQPQAPELLRKCIEHFGTSKIFQARSQRLKLKIQLLGFFALAPVVLAGGVLLAIKIDPKATEVIENMAIACGLVIAGQGLFALWSLFAQWTEHFEYALRSVNENTRLVFEFEDLLQAAKTNGGSLPSSLITSQITLTTESRMRSSSDEEKDLTPSEKRYGMREGLHQFQTKCTGCNEIPLPQTPSKCQVCGV